VGFSLAKIGDRGGECPFLQEPRPPPPPSGRFDTRGELKFQAGEVPARDKQPTTRRVSRRQLIRKLRHNGAGRCTRSRSLAKRHVLFTTALALTHRRTRARATMCVSVPRPIPCMTHGGTLHLTINWNETEKRRSRSGAKINAKAIQARIRSGLARKPRVALSRSEASASIYKAINDQDRERRL
jgi:hypothetical protein